MLFDDSYQTIANSSEGLFKDRGSKFLGFVYPIRNEADVKLFLQNLRELHSKANHHCYAYRLGMDRTSFRVNDDGEPIGSAGKPILNVLYAKNLTNVLVVVVRYFGGTLLGITGLINAYKQASVEAIANSEIVTKFVRDIYELRYEYGLMNEVMKVIKNTNLLILSQVFDNTCLLEIEIRKSQLNPILARFEQMEGLEIQYKKTI